MSEPTNKGFVGLTNIGNTCYGNATLQAIRHQVDFTLFFLQGNHAELISKKMPSEKTELLTSYGKLVKALWEKEGGAESTREFWRPMVLAAVKAGFGQFRAPIPHDAHEFLAFLLDQFHEGLAEQVAITIRAPEQQTELYQALTFWKTSFEKTYSPLVELVFGLQRKSVKCECSKESITWATHNMIKVTVPASAGPVDLLELMRRDDNDEVIEGYACDACKPARTKATISHSLWRLGNWVIVVLKRNENSGRRINTHVNIPLTTSFGTLFCQTSTEPSKDSQYELFSTIHHHGSSGGGHYTAHARHPVTGHWAHYDDESVTHVHTPNLNASTYIVMYRRIATAPATLAPATLAPATLAPA